VLSGYAMTSRRRGGSRYYKASERFSRTRKEADGGSRSLGKAKIHDKSTAIGTEEGDRVSRVNVGMDHGLICNKQQAP
jgi:hypothetical protein